MAFLWFLFLNTLCSLSITNAELIDSLPGQPTDVSFKQYSGYIVTDDYHGRALFYYFAEAESDSKLSMPLTLWLGGGSGCASVGVSVFMENGPFRPGKDGNLIKNDFSWNLESNMLYVDSPIGIAFSYTNSTSDYTNWNDIMTAIENMKFLLNWFEKFPEYRNLDFYLAGDSYAGHLVPQLAALVLKYNEMPFVKPIKLKGIALGNPLLDIMMSLDSDDFQLYHGVISEELRNMQKKLCNSTTHFLELANNKHSKGCEKVMDKRAEEMGDFEIQDLLLPICISSNSIGQHLASETAIGDPCLYDTVEVYLNKPNVQKALHVNSDVLPNLKWERGCSAPLQNQVIHHLGDNIIPTLSALLQEHIPILLYSGDQDLTIPAPQTRKIANMLAKELKLKTLQKNGPWYNGIQIGGWSEAFGKLSEGKNVTYLTFATVKGGGHMVPFTSPSESLTLFKAFLTGSPPPRTNSTSS